VTQRYFIEKLLIEGAAPFDPLSHEEYDDLKRDIELNKGKRLDKMPVYLSADDILYDGHNRLRILLELGRKTIGEDEFIRNPKIKGYKAAYFEAWKVQQNRRNATGEAKAKGIWKMVTEWGMSQTAIGKQIGIRQQSVSELMNKYPASLFYDEMPKVITTRGEDGKEYTRRITDPIPSGPELPTPPPPPRPRPWEPDGSATLTLIRARKALADNTPTDSSLNSFQRNHLRNLLRDLAKDCANFIDDYLTESM
jgi:predicted XRE-type DNA-binding protein